MRRTLVSFFAANVITLIGVPASAAYYVGLQEIGTNVVAIGSGSFDLTDLTYSTSGRPATFVAANRAEIRMGNGIYDAYQGITGPLSFGPGETFSAEAESGPFTGLLRNEDIQGVFVPQNYVSSALLPTSTATWKSATFSTLGLSRGTFVWHWGSDDHADTFTLRIGNLVPEPSTWAMMIIGFGMIGARLRFRRDVRQALS